MANQTTNINPWKGLNFYKEGDVIYGRNSEIESLSHCIFNNTQTVLFGKSGIGKSSILNAGIFPLARKKGMIPVPIRFNHDNGFSYVEQVRLAIANSGAEAHEIVPVIDPKKETLWEYLHRNIFFDKDGKRTQLLIVLDQFEEIFTLQKDEKTKLAFFDDIADLINDIIPLYIVNANKKQGGGNEEKAHEVSGNLDDIDIDIDINETSALASENKYLQKIDHHFVFTLREDFLSYLERYTAYIPGMKSNRYALLPLNEEQAADIIMKPIEGLIDISVAELIIQKVTGCSDFTLDGVPEIEVDAAVLSLYLSRIFIKKGDQDTITADIVNQFSADIIKDFYEESVSNLPQEEIEHLENRLLTYDGRRNNVSRNDLLQEKVSYKVIKTLVEDRKLLRQFSYQDDIRVEYMHDILCPIVKERIDNRAEALKKAEEQRIMEEQQMLILAEEKRKREEIEQLAWEERKAAMELRKKKRIATAIALFVLILGVIVYWGGFHEYSTYCVRFTTVNGWPVSVGKAYPGLRSLVDIEDINTPVYYQLVRKGWHGNYERVYILNNDGKPVPNVFIRLPMVGLYEGEGGDKAAREFATKQRQTYYWEYIPDDDHNLQRRTAYNKKGEVLYSILYYNSNSSNDSVAKQLWASIIDKDGKPLKVRDNGMDRMRITVDDKGHYIKYMYFSENGVPQKNYQGAYGVEYTMNDKNYVTKIQALDAFGDSIVGECNVFKDFDKYGRATTTATYTSNTVTFTRKNREDVLLFDNGLLQNHHITRLEINKSTKVDSIIVEDYTYDSQGRLIEKHIETNGKEIECIKTAYDGDNLKELITYSTNDGCYKEIHNNNGIIYYKGKDEDHLKRYYERKIEKKEVDHNKKDTCYHYSYYNVDESGEHLNYKERLVYDSIGQLFQRIKYDNKGNRTLSIEYEIENGIVVGEHVIGLGGDTIRCPDWSVRGLCYYRMKYVRDFYGNIVERKAINEFGEPSMITISDQQFITNPVPATRMEEETKDGYTYGISSYKSSISDVDPLNKVNYIHITDRNGIAHKNGLRDGDLLVNIIGNTYKIARPNTDKNKFDIITINIENTDNNIGFKVYDVYYTPDEMKRYNESINTEAK